MKRALTLLMALTIAVMSTACSINLSIDKAKSDDTPASSAVAEENPAAEVTEAEEAAAEETKAENTAETQAAKSTQSSGIMPTDKYADFLGQYLDLSHYKDANVTDKRYSVSLDSNYYPAYKNDANVRLFTNGGVKLENDAVVTIPMKVSELIDQGWTFKSQSKPNETLGANLFDTGNKFIKGNKTIRIQCCNRSDEAVKYTDADVFSIELEYYETDNNYANPVSNPVSFDIDGRVNNHSDLESIISALGEPNVVFYSIIGTKPSSRYAHLMLTYSSKGEPDYRFTFSGDGSKLVELRVS